METSYGYLPKYVTGTVEAKKIDIDVKIRDIGIKSRDLGIKAGISGYKAGIGQILDRNLEAKMTDMYYNTVTPYQQIYIVKT